MSDLPRQLALGIQENLCRMLGRFPNVATRHDYYMSLAYTVRDLMLRQWAKTASTYYQEESRTVSYLSAEFLIGPQLGRNLVGLDLYEAAREAVAELGHCLDELLDEEDEPGLGNGGLGRLAACYMESMATRQIPAIGYGIRYEFGIFKQDIVDGWQVEKTDRWLRLGYPWEVVRPEIAYEVKLGGHTEPHTDETGRYCVRWIPERVVMGTPCDTLVQGYKVPTVNLLRLWKAEAHESFDFQAFNVGDYYRAVDKKIFSENITKVLYPNDEPAAGKQLRLEQQYFFVSCSLQDMIRIYLQRETSLDKFADKYVIQLNDTHPTIGIAELMRLLVDDYRLDWDAAWRITSQAFAYTNHTLLPEALEKWSLSLFARVLPRHLEIIYEINRRFLDEVQKKHPDDADRLSRLSLIEEGRERHVRMAHLACVGSRAINGVAALHTRLLGETVLKDFYELWPEKFSNKTNGVTLRRFLLLANPGLSRLITDAIGERWVRDADHLRGIEKFIDDPAFLEQWRAVKHSNKSRLSKAIEMATGIHTDPETMLDVQVKRLHEYKRQHLNVLHAITLYQRLKNDRRLEISPRTIVFGGKAAPGYFMAKLIIKLINSVAEVVNRDRDVRDRLKIAFFPNFSVKTAQIIYPGADLSEQISMAGTEASGTGNMKFAFNGALTIGTQDGANVEIREEVGAENFFLFGLTAEEVRRRKAQGYQPRDLYEHDPDLRVAIDLISSGAFSRGDRELFQPLVNSLLEQDPFLVLADFASYVECQDEVGEVYKDRDRWTKMSVLNVARMGKFSADRAIQEYCRDIWHAQRVRPLL